MKQLKYIEGNLLLNKEVEVIGHQANCQNTFGSGIARSIKEMYPEAYAADTEAAVKKENTLGNLSYADIPEATANRHGTNICRIYNLYGQNLFGAGTRRTNYDALYSALESMTKMLRPTEADKHMFDFCRSPVVGFPYKMGSALGGGSWEVVSRLIEVAFDGYSGDVLIVKLRPVLINSQANVRAIGNKVFAEHSDLFEKLGNL